jgi:alginate O-acetyltransferase complex protein AlgJ
MTVAGNDGWLFLRSELRHISVGPFWGEQAAKATQAASPDKADPLPAILDFHAQLKARGIELILAPVPAKVLVYPEKLGHPSAPRLDEAHQQFLQLLRSRGVRVLDLGEVFAREKAAAGSPLLYCRTDSHWSPHACAVAARQVKETLGTPPWLKARPGAFPTRAETRAITGDLAGGQGTETLPARVVQAPVASLEDRSSPILLLGDSHTLVFHAGGDMHGVGAGLADQLAAELGLAVDVLGVRGSGATPARINLLRRTKADPAWLAGKKVVVWCFAAREFTESSGWSVVKLSQ